MIFKTSIDKIQKESQIETIIGKPYSFFQKIKYGIYGSPKYKLVDIFPENISLTKSNDLIACNFEIKKNGLAMYFRYLSDEYALVGRYNQITFQTSKNYFELQINGLSVKAEILDKKAHLNFLQRYFKFSAQNIDTIT